MKIKQRLNSQHETKYTNIRVELENDSNVSPDDRMFCYLYLYEHSEFGICSKFGETFVVAGDNACENVLKRIDQQGHEHGESHTVIMCWDVSEYATKVDRNKKHGHVDSYISNKIGLEPYRVKCDEISGGADLYKRSPEFVQDLVQKELDSLNCKRPVCGLTEWQYDAVCRTLDADRNGAKTIVADMCARAGKTLYTAACILEMGDTVNVVLSYVLTSMTSFANDINRFEQFKNIEFVDTSIDGWEQRLLTAVDCGKQVIAFVSMCGESGQEAAKSQKLTWIMDQGKSVNLFVDEADFGAWKQSMIRENVRPDTFTVLMTGTNIERASVGYKIDDQITVSYVDLLMAKKSV